MLPRAAPFALLALLLAAPIGSAEVPACKAHPSDDSTAVYPLTPGVYFVVGDPSNTGFWTESNNVPGLQMSDCVGSDGVLWYHADTSYAGKAPPVDKMIPSTGLP